jgi:acyl-homoserine-lactone acylase
MSECNPRKTRSYQLQWDEWGMPIISSTTMSGLCQGWGFAQTFLNPNLLLLAYLRGQGRSAEYVGAHSDFGASNLTKQPDGVDFLQSDVLVRSLQIPQLADEAWSNQDDEVKACITAFVTGVNECREEYPERFDSRLRDVKITPKAVLGHTLNILIGFQMMLRLPTIATWMQSKEISLPSWQDFANAGSNNCAIGPSKSKEGHPMLVINPHTQWDVDLNTFTEARLELTDGSGFCFQGAAMLGWPMPIMGCNAHLGYGGTVNTQNGITFYELSADNGQFELDNTKQTLSLSGEAVKVRTDNGEQEIYQHMVAYSSAHNAHAVATRDEKLLLINVGSRGNVCLLRQLLDMMRAQSLSGFQTALKQHQLPLFNTIYAGRDSQDQSSHIHFSWHSLAPQREKGSWEDWWHVLDGHLSANIAKGQVSYEQLLKCEDPDSGWLQNCNDSPHFATLPSPFDPADHPDWLCPVFSNIRCQSFSRILAEQEQFDLDSFTKAKLSTRVELAFRVVPQMCKAINEGHTQALQACKKVLASWDFHTNPSSKGAYLFLHWLLNLGIVDTNASPLFSDSYDQVLAADPERHMDSLLKPGKIANMTHALSILEKAAEILTEEGHALDVAWGDVLTISHGKYSFPAVGGPGDPMGIISAIPLKPALRPFIKGGALPANRIENEGGETFVMVAQFTPEGVEGGSLVSYGQSSHPDSKHFGDQVELVSRRQLRPFKITKQ